MNVKVVMNRGEKFSSVFTAYDQNFDISFVNAVLLKLASKSKLYYDRRSVGQSVMVSTSHLAPSTNFSLSLIIFIPLRAC
jgi:hypothetical protein